MDEYDTEWIARRAYTLWEEEGRPDGRHDHHWQQAVEAYQTLKESANATTSNAQRRIRKARESTPDSTTETAAAASTPPSRGARKG
jgi:hypothetical protein